MSKSFTLIVTKSPFDFRHAENAAKFCLSALEQGYSVEQVFFYQSGVHNASSLLNPPSDEPNLHKIWLSINEKYGVPLNVCISAGLRRGVCYIEDDKTNEQSLHLSTLNGNLHPPFEHVGLSAYFEALASDTINVQF